METKNVNDLYTNYAMVFDLDETLGHFSQIATFWNLTNHYLSYPVLDNKIFFKFLDSFQDFLRPNILKLLYNLKRKKQRGICDYVIIFTNNMHKQWVEMIKEYFHYRIKYPLFDKIIAGFRDYGNQVEICRTSHDKSHKDFINCSKLPANTKICFLDDLEHHQMENPNVLYIHIKPYQHHEKFTKMADIFYKQNREIFLAHDRVNTYENYKKYIINSSKKYQLEYLKKSTVEKNIDYMLSQQIIKEINRFFKTRPKNFTVKKKKKLFNKTIKLL